jgi:chromosome segregation ATPase
MTDTSMQPRDGKKARNAIKDFAQMMKGLMELDAHLVSYDDLDVAILDKQKSLDELTTKESGLAAKIADVDAACAATVAEAEARKDAIESKIDAASTKLTAVEEQIATAKAELDDAVSNRASDWPQEPLMPSSAWRN